MGKAISDEDWSRSRDPIDPLLLRSVHIARQMDALSARLAKLRARSMLECTWAQQLRMPPRLGRPVEGPAPAAGTQPDNHYRDDEQPDAKK